MAENFDNEFNNENVMPQSEDTCNTSDTENQMETAYPEADVMQEIIADAVPEAEPANEIYTGTVNAESIIASELPDEASVLPPAAVNISPTTYFDPSFIQQKMTDEANVLPQQEVNPEPKSEPAPQSESEPTPQPKPQQERAAAQRPRPAKRPHPCEYDREAYRREPQYSDPRYSDDRYANQAGYYPYPPQGGYDRRQPDAYRPGYYPYPPYYPYQPMPYQPPMPPVPPMPPRYAPPQAKNMPYQPPMPPRYAPPQAKNMPYQPPTSANIAAPNSTDIQPTDKQNNKNGKKGMPVALKAFLIALASVIGAIIIGFAVYGIVALVSNAVEANTQTPASSQGDVSIPDPFEDKNSDTPEQSLPDNGGNAPSDGQNQLPQIQQNEPQANPSKFKLGIIVNQINEPIETPKGTINNGLIIVGMEKTSSLAETDIQMYDIITKINGKDAVSTDQLHNLMDTMNEGDKLKLTIARVDAEGNISYFDVEATLQVNENYNADNNSASKPDNSASMPSL